MRFGVNIEKSCSFRGATQHFGNTYYYEGPFTESSTTALNALIDEIVRIEKLVHTNDTTFVRARLWSQIGSPSQNQMIIDRALSGTGSITPHSTIDRERTLLVRWRAGNDSKGRPVFLRKYFHFWGQTLGGTTVDVSAVANTASLATPIRTYVEARANELKQVPAGILGSGQMDLCSKNGRMISGATQAHQYLEHHQLGDEWRGN